MLPWTIAAGVATGVGSLPHTDARAAAALVLRCLPELPAVPELPVRSALEGSVAQWARGVPEVCVQEDASLALVPDADRESPVCTEFDVVAHGGLLAFVDVAREQPVPPRWVKAQVAGPLTLGVALIEAGLPCEQAFRRGAEAARAWARAVEQLILDWLPGVSLVMFFDEPALARWREDGPIHREEATDLLSGALAATEGVTGVHVCGGGDLRLALDAGPQVVGVDVASVNLEEAVYLSRFLDGDGWVAWGAVPTDRPVGEQAAPLWKALVDLWCELTRRGCDAVRLRTQAMVTPACGLAGHGASQAERAMCLAREIGRRVHDQAAATKLTVGA